MNKKWFLALPIVLLLLLSLAPAQVLGPCGAKHGGEKGAKIAEAAPAPAADLQVQPIPLPGQRAIDFQLPAVVGNEIKTIKLSDYQGKWRVVCFFPAAFTFV